MLKGALLSFMQKLNSQEAEDYRITLLKAFMQQPDIELLSDSDDIPFAQFDDFMRQMLQHDKEKIEQFYSPEASPVFNEFRSIADRTSQFGDFSSIKLLAVLGQADEATKILLSASFQFHQGEGGAYWVDAMIAAGCRPSWTV